MTREIQAGAFDPPSDIEMVMHAAWLLAGVAIALAAAGCTGSEAANPAPPNANVAHAKPASSATDGNVQDLTY
jgi:hypothetical protein